ncbi:hypothetical protein GCM10017668_18790 [Streptomyces tuirus]|uniref:Uncharacterized protein n=1 Tax=Streptomyces tuirus TaxID=68278 RepID=A0A7G1NEA0_9ACTN|nr:hypothetical protein GCM10017668_18790 [Streptomyces tuirus]
MRAVARPAAGGLVIAVPRKSWSASDPQRMIPPADADGKCLQSLAQLSDSPPNSWKQGLWGGAGEAGERSRRDNHRHPLQLFAARSFASRSSAANLTDARPPTAQSAAQRAFTLKENSCGVA